VDHVVLGRSTGGRVLEGEASLGCAVGALTRADLTEVRLDASLDPLLTLDAVRDDDGVVVDFDVVDVNSAACAFMRTTPESVLGSSLIRVLPAEAVVGLLSWLSGVVDAGVPVSLVDSRHPHERQPSERRYDVHAEPDGDRLVVGFRDVTGVHAAERLRRVREDLAEVQEQYQQAMDGSTVGMCLVSTDGYFLKVNDALCEMLGREPDDLMATTWQELTHPDDLDTDLELVDDVLAGRRLTYRLLKRFLTADGAMIWGELSVAAVRDASGRVKYFVSQIVDVSERLAAEDALAERERLLSAVLNNSSDLVVQVDRQLRIRFVNQRLIALTGVPFEDWVGRTLADLGYQESEFDRATTTLEEVFATGEEGILEYHVDSPDGALWFDARMTPERAVDGSVAHVIVSSRDVTDRHLAEQRLVVLATTDPLTGLANRSTILSEIDLSLGAGDSAKLQTAVLLIDLDRFKNINDSLGHAVGDALLVAAGARLQGLVRAGDLVGRAGGDEFVVVMRGIRDPEEAQLAATGIVEAFRDPFRDDGRELFATATVGIALSGAESTSVDLLREADTAMYLAKNAGRDRTGVFNDDLRSAVSARLAVENDLRHALSRGELAVWYQPEVSLRTGRVVAFEALLRWSHHDGNVRSADSFIDVAEDTGLILDIGDWVLGQVFSQAAQWSTADPVTVRFNLSALQLAEAGLLEAIDAALLTSGADPSLLCAEITETALLRQTTTVRENLLGLRDRGLRLAIDDFGTGYASLTYLREYPIDTLKIDRSFIANITTDQHSARLVAGIVCLAQSLAITVTAEGIETTEQARAAVDAGCPSAQGYLYSAAVNPTQADRLRRTTFLTS
jgi:diguanylate cyclase (GGDEF)-like protein/PAS domain S-box-containing protein